MVASGRITCTRRLEWDAMHRIRGHEGNCRAFHGHRYAAEITCCAPALDTLGRVIDFSVIKDVVGGWIDRHFDHTAILHDDDRDEAVALIAASNEQAGKPVYFLAAPPTAENIARELGRIAGELLEPHGIEISQVRVWETPNCYATWTAG